MDVLDEGIERLGTHCEIKTLSYVARPMPMKHQLPHCSPVSLLHLTTLLTFSFWQLTWIHLPDASPSHSSHSQYVLRVFWYRAHSRFVCLGSTIDAIFDILPDVSQARGKYTYNVLN